MKLAKMISIANECIRDSLYNECTFLILQCNEENNYDNLSLFSSRAQRVSEEEEKNHLIMCFGYGDGCKMNKRNKIELRST
jgi:hypothetical protein